MGQQYRSMVSCVDTACHWSPRNGTRCFKWCVQNEFYYFIVHRRVNGLFELHGWWNNLILSVRVALHKPSSSLEILSWQEVLPLNKLNRPVRTSSKILTRLELSKQFRIFGFKYHSEWNICKKAQNKIKISNLSYLTVWQKTRIKPVFHLTNILFRPRVIFYRNSEIRISNEEISTASECNICSFDRTWSPKSTPGNNWRYWSMGSR